MSTGQHTTGPLLVEQIGRRPVMRAVAATVIAPTGERLADFRHVADANLFAASPAMLTALKAVQFSGKNFSCGECGGQPSTGHAP